jgi:DNA-directed RNA polymerase subunit RPC12/RpoP
MENKTSDTVKSGRSFDSAYGFSFAIAIGLLLFIAGLIITLTLGEGTSIGLIFGIPLLVAGIILPLVMLRGGLKHNIVNSVCPYCQTPIKTSDATIRLNCPACNRKIVVREMNLEKAE